MIFDEERGNYSLRDVAEATGLGKSTVGNMRSILEEADAFDFNPRAKTWNEVKRLRQESRDHDPEWANKRAKAWAGNLRRQLGDKPNQTPECFFEALEIGYPQLFPQGVPQHWGDDPGIRLEMKTAEEDFEF